MEYENVLSKEKAVIIIEDENVHFKVKGIGMEDENVHSKRKAVNFDKSPE